MPAASVSDEVSHLMRHGPARGPRKGRRMSQRQAVAASLSMARRGEFGRSTQRTARRRRKRR